MEKLKNLTYGVDRLFIENPRFNTTLISVNFYLPLTKRGLSQYALLSGVMASSSANYPNFSDLNLKQKELYAASVGATSDKIGDIQLIKFYSTYLNNEVVGADIETEVNNLLLELIFNPLVENGGFKESEITREKRLILEKIKSLVNERRRYAIKKTTETMFKGTPYATSKLGDSEDIKDVTATELYDAYLYMLKNAYIRVQVTAKEYNGNFDTAFLNAIKPYRENKDFSLPQSTAKTKTEITDVKEKAQINQAKLCLAFTNEKAVESAAITLFADIFGGGPYSLLFTNVREKLSLCYYCAARAQKNKGLLMVDSGVEYCNIEKAKSQILAEKAKIENGEFDTELIATSKKAILESLKANNDNDMVLDTWYTLRAGGELYSPETLGKRIEAVTKEEIIAAAKSFKLDTVYALISEDAND